jgi:hypothetical protein
MKNIFIMINLILIPLICFSYEWTPIGPDTIIVNDYLCSLYGDLLCTPDGIYLQTWEVSHENWEDYPSKLPVIQAAHYDTSGVLVILNGGTDSDGVYKFNRKSKTFTLHKFCLKPNFLYYYQRYPKSRYYCGYEGGLLVSSDGKEWQEVEFFKDKTILAMTTMGPNCLVTDSSNVYFSADTANNWKIQSTAPPNTRNIIWDQCCKAYLIFAGDSKSSGLWSSSDSGKTWQVEFWSVEMSALFYAYYFVIVGWDKFYEGYGGVAIWPDDQNDLQFINKGLPRTGINRITQNDLIDCINAVACTDSGAYICCDFNPTAIFAEKYQPIRFNLSQNYPNPFNNETVIAYQLNDAEFVDLSIYNALGKKIITLASAKHAPGNYVVHWNSSGYSSGIYYSKLKVGKSSQIKKMILLK